MGTQAKFLNLRGGIFHFSFFLLLDVQQLHFLDLLSGAATNIASLQQVQASYLSFQEQIGGQKMFKNWSEKIRDKSWDKYGKIGGRHGIRFAVQPLLTRKILKKLSRASREAVEIFFCGPRAIFF